jgi:hypothetical protein
MCALPRAVELVDGAQPTIRLEPGRYDIAGSLTLGSDMRIVGRDAVVARDAGGTGATLVIIDGTHIELDYVAVEGGDGDTSGFGIGCTAAALIGREIAVQGNAAAGIHSVGCAVTLRRARIAANRDTGIAASGGSVSMERSTVLANQGGGVVLTGARFDLQNNVIVKNGSPTSLLGGLLITQIAAREDHVLAFNTVAHNQASAGSTPGVICSVVVVALSFGSNIVFNNATGTQVEGGNCSWTYSDIGPVPAPGIGNVDSDPQFIAPEQNNFHLPASSTLRDIADPAATLADDIDGESRPQGGRRDPGADEIK